MQKIRTNFLFFGLIALATTGLWRPATAGNITGTVTTGPASTSVEPGTPLNGVEVWFLDASNAELITTISTDNSGHYDSGFLPIGAYRALFTSWESPGDVAVYPEYLGAGPANFNFCDGSVINLASGESATADEDLVEDNREPSLQVTWDQLIEGVVTDAGGKTIEGIEVQVFYPEDGLRKISSKSTVITTDANGYFRFEGEFWVESVKVRFFDPQYRFFSQFYNGTSMPGPDNYCGAALLDVRANVEQPVANAVLREIPSDALAQSLIDEVGNLQLSADTSTMLATPLIRAVSLITDANSGNDAGVCSQLDAFISRLEVQRERGEISEEDAANLLALTNSTRDSLGCN